MKRALLFMSALAAIVSITNAQVRVKPLPKPGYEQRIREYIDTMRIVDTHEHLRDPQQMVDAGECNFDFMLLMQGYPFDDIASAGMPASGLELLRSNANPKEKWEVLEPYWERASNTAFCRVPILTADKLYGVENINASSVELLSEKVQKNYEKPREWFLHVLCEKCNIEYIIEDNPYWERNDYMDTAIFRFVTRFDHFISINSKKSIENLAWWNSSGVNTLDDLIVALGNAFEAAMAEGMVGIKSGLAYNRIIQYDDATKEEAEAIFTEMMKSQNEWPFAEAKPLQDYMMHRVLDLARENKLPVQIHTGLQAGKGNIIENSKPTRLVNLFMEYPDVNFILFHGSYPYGGELSTLAKIFSNVYLDLCWLYIISPSYSERYLNEWLETVPANKLMAFGGDCMLVEGVYGHLLMARQVISNVLISKVRDGYFTEDEALKVAQMMLYDNALKIFKLK